MAENESQDRLSRRKALKIMVGSAGVAANLPALTGAAAPTRATLCHIAPAGQAAKAAHIPEFFNAAQLEEIAALAETIIPTDEHSPGARAAGVHEFIDHIVAAADQHTKELWTQGLAAMDQMAERAYTKKFNECQTDQQTALLEKIAANEEHPQTPEEHFFVALKRATIEGYYTSAIGIHQDLGYQGNTALLDFPGCTHTEHKGDPKQT